MNARQPAAGGIGHNPGACPGVGILVGQSLRSQFDAQWQARRQRAIEVGQRQVALAALSAQVNRVGNDRIEIIRIGPFGRRIAKLSERK